MAHPNEEKLRKAYADFARGDLEAYWSNCDDDFTFTVPGNSKVAGSFTGKEAFMGMIGNVMAVCGGTFQEEVIDVLANDTHGVVLAKHRFQRGDATKEYETAHVYEIKDGVLQRCQEQPKDHIVFEEAWA